MTKSLLALVFFFLILVGPASAWDPYGHMMVDSVAQTLLTPKARSTAESLAAELKYPGTTYTLVTIGCWMDDIRSDDPAIPFSGQFKTWHYINRGLDPGERPGAHELEPGSDSLEKGNVVQGLKRAIAVLKGGQDPFITSRAQALAMVCHLTADIHQPLHCASGTILAESGRVTSDSGGNRVIIDNSVPMTTPRGKSKTNLHAFWDAAYRAALNDSGDVVFDEAMADYTRKDPALLAREMEGLVGMTPAAGAPLESRVDLWMDESNTLAREFAFGALDGEAQSKFRKVSPDYVSKARTIGRERIVLAGHRLARILNDTLGNE